MSRASHAKRRKRKAQERSAPGTHRFADELLGSAVRTTDEIERLLEEQGLTPGTLSTVNTLAREADLATLQRYRERRLRIFGAKQPRVACGEGCSWCCRGPQVLVPAYEVFGIVDWMKAHLPTDEVDAVHARARAVVQQFDRECLTLPADRAAPRVVCPLLVNDECSIYPARPGSCRGWTSSDPAPCRAYSEGDDHTKQSSPDVIVHQGGQMVSSRLEEILDGDVRGVRVDLPSALLVVLENPNAVEEFIAGQPIFAEAVRRARRTVEWREARERGIREGAGPGCDRFAGQERA